VRSGSQGGGECNVTTIQNIEMEFGDPSRRTRRCANLYTDGATYARRFGDEGSTIPLNETTPAKEHALGNRILGWM
jgi:hypothetical protein